MTVNELRQRQTTLQTVRLDLAKWPLGQSPDGTAAPEVPVVAVDWSEIYSYMTFTPPREHDSEDLFAIHYAGLNYLLFRLPCRLVLLPPYTVEMAHFVEMAKTNALAFKLTDSRHLSDKHASLLQQMTKHQHKFPGFFEAVRAGDWSALESAPTEAWTFLEDLLKDHLPSVFLSVQERTAGVMQSLKILMNATDGEQRRLAPLDSLHTLPAAPCKRSIDGWEYWLTEMATQRPRLERQNRADAMALAYLQALHQAFAGKNVPLFFASRSVSMLHVMENHAGEFSPYRGVEAESGRNSRASWRSWDYFAELGYYSTRLSGDQGATVAEIERDLREREAKFDQRIVNASREDGDGFDRSALSDWETLRGTFDLEGAGAQEHWKRIRHPQEHMLVDLMKSVLSAEDATVFLNKRTELAHRILGEIESILASFTPDVMISASSDAAPDVPTFASLTSIATSHLNFAALFGEYVRLTTRTALSDSTRDTIALLRKMTKPGQSATITTAGHQLLHLLTEDDAKREWGQAVRDWLAGTALFFCRAYPESRSYLESWISTHSSAASPGLGLATRALCAEAHRQRRDYESGMQVLFDIQQEKFASMSSSERLIAHCLKAQLMLDWMEPCKEIFEIFPKPPDRRTAEHDIIVPLVEAVADGLATSTAAVESLHMTATNLVLYLVARHVPEHVRDLTANESELNRRLGWFLSCGLSRDKIEDWLRKRMEAAPQPRPLDTLGYYNWKLYLYTREPARFQTAVKYFNQAKKEADRLGDAALVRLVAEHSQWARQTLRTA